MGVGNRTRPATDTMRVLVVDEHELTALGLECVLSSRGWEVESSTAQTPADVLDHARRFTPGSVLLRHRPGQPAGSGLDLVPALVATGTSVVVLTAERRRAALARFLEAGASGWVRKSATLDELDAALRRLHDGGRVLGRTDCAAHLDALRVERAREQQIRATFEQLSAREACVLAALSDGLSADEIARENCVSLATIRSQIRAVLVKLDVRSQLTAASIGGAHRELLPQRQQSARDRRRIAAPEQDTPAHQRVSA